MRVRTIGVVVASLALGAGGSLVACGDDDLTPASRDASADGSDAASGADGTTAVPDASDGSVQDATNSDAGDASDGGVDRGPTKIPMPNVPAKASPNGLFWQYGTDAALYIADEGNDVIMRWDDAKGFSLATKLPSPIAMDAGGLGQVIRLEDGTFFVTRFGYGVGGGSSTSRRPAMPG